MPLVPGLPPCDAVPEGAPLKILAEYPSLTNITDKNTKNAKSLSLFAQIDIECRSFGGSLEVDTSAGAFDYMLGYS